MTALFKKVFSHFLFQVLCLLGISFISRYRVPDLSDTNWDTALFLTPIGILKNFMSENPVMRSFYSDLSKGQLEMASWQLILIAFILLVQIYQFTRLARLVRINNP